jgi:hypothetical protein
MPIADNTLKAIEIHIFSEAMCGTGEGFRDLGLQSKSTALTGSVAPIGAFGRSLQRRR